MQMGIKESIQIKTTHNFVQRSLWQTPHAMQLKKTEHTQNNKQKNKLGVANWIALTNLRRPELKQLVVVLKEEWKTSY